MEKYHGAYQRIAELKSSVREATKLIKEGVEGIPEQLYEIAKKELRPGMKIEIWDEKGGVYDQCGKEVVTIEKINLRGGQFFEIELRDCQRGTFRPVNSATRIRILEE